MIIKKFQAETEALAVLKAKEEMGSSAVVVNIKTTKHRGISRLFKKDFVEVTAALEETQNNSNSQINEVNVAIGDVHREKAKMNTFESAMFQEEKAMEIEEKLNSLQNLLETSLKPDYETINNMREFEKVTEEKEVTDAGKNMKFLKLVYNQLIDNEVDERYANEIIGSVQTSIKKETNVDSILAAVYQKVILKIGQPKAIELEEGKRKVVFFVGPTGVGKTTTIAKLASYFKVEKKVKVGLITSDTYRIAAVEQLRTYADILDVPLHVIYTLEELNRALRVLDDCDIVLVDTAGRSHKNDEQCAEIEHLINDCVCDDDAQKEMYLVLSAATKYKDLQRIYKIFGRIGEYSIIFTKLDETICLGNILNMKLTTGVPVSYITSGQNVPDDIGVLDPQKIARSILGASE